MKKQYTMFLVLLLGLLGFSSHAEGPTFTLTDGSSAALWYMPDVNTKNKIQDFENGSNQIPITGDAWDYYIVANDADATLTVTHDGTPFEIWTDNTFSGNQYTWLGDEATGEYVITTTKAAPAGTNFYLEEGNAYLLDRYTWKKVKDLEPGDNYIVLNTTEDHQSYSIHGVGVAKAADLIITDADGNSVFVRDYNDPEYGYSATIYASSASSKYTIKAIASVAAEPETHIFVTDGSSVKGKYQDMSTYQWVDVPLNNSDNLVKVPVGTQLFRIVANEGHTLASCVSVSGQNISATTNSFTGEVYFQINPSEFEASYTVTTDGTVPQPGNTFTVIVDDASKMSFCNSKYSPISLTNGENVITIEETFRYIFYSNSGGFYSVTLNDEPLADQYGTYYLPVENLAGSVLNIKANYPDENWTYAINFTGEPVEWERAAISEIVDGELIYTDIPMSSNTSITAKAGSEICLWAKDADSFDRNQTTVTCTGKGNEYKTWYTSTYNIIFKLVENNGTLTVNAVKVAPPKDINFHLNAGSAASIHRYANDQLSKYQSLNEGDNIVAIPNDGNYYYIVANNKGAELTVKDDKDNTLNAQANSYYFDGRKFVLVTGVDSESFDITTVGGVVEDNDNNNITVTVNTPSAVKFYSKYSPYTPEFCEAIDIALVEGTQTIKVAKTVSQMSIVPADEESVINSVSYKKAGSADWTDASRMGYTMVTYFDVWPEDGMEINIDASHVTYDSHALIYTDNGNNNTVTMKSEGGREIMLGSGPNDVNFNADDSKFTVTNSRTTDLKIYVNGSMIEGNTFQLNDNDIVKIFELSDKPVTVTFAITATAAEVEGVKVTDVMVDGVTPVNYPAEPIEVLPGSGVSFKVAAPEGTTILVMNGEYEVAPAEGVYTVWPTADTEVAISYTAQQAFALMLKGSKIGEVAMTEADGLWTATLPVLTGSFTVVSNDGTVKLGSNGSKVELGKEYEASADSSVGMSLECGSAAEVTVTVDLEKKTVLVNGTTGIITLTRDQLDADAIYYDLTGRRIEAANIANGLYIRVAGSTVTKIAVK